MGQGKEAATVRQVFLVVVLVGASFLGGAFVNGPGLHWVQTQLTRSLGLSAGNEIASVDLKATASPETTADGLQPRQEVADIAQDNSVSAPQVTADDEYTERNVPARRLSSQSQVKSKHVGSKPPRSQQPPGTSGPSVQLSSTQTKNSAGISTPFDPHVTPAILDSLAALLPPNPSVPESPLPSSARSPSASKSVGDGANQWTLLERKMRTLGVSRFMVEAEPGGRAMFSCLIPLAGRQAIAQRFEAEGDDMFQAAQAAVRRIGLWRATQVLPR
jgi:hypothetical protein